MSPIQATLNTNGFCDRVGQFATSTAATVGKYAKIAGNAIKDGAAKVAVFAKNFFAAASVKAGPFLATLRGHLAQGMTAAREHLKSNPKLYAVGVGALGLGMGLVAACNKFCKKGADPVQAQAPAPAQEPAAVVKQQVANVD